MKHADRQTVHQALLTITACLLVLMLHQVISRHLVWLDLDFQNAKYGLPNQIYASLLARNRKQYLLDVPCYKIIYSGFHSVKKSLLPLGLISSTRHG